MDNAKQIVHYLEALALALVDLGVTVQFHILIAGGAYMLLQNQRRSTEDIDFALIAEPQAPTLNKVFRTTVQRGEVASRVSSIPGAAEFKQAAANVAAHHDLPPDWMNDEAAVYYYDDAPDADVFLWQSFGGVLFVYLPTMEYIFATKMAAYRRKDLNDIQMLVRELKIQTREAAQVVIDRFLLPEAQQFWEVEKKLKRLFRQV